MSRTDYHREYYWRNVERRREQAVQSKRRRKVKSIAALMRLWGRA